VEIDKSSGKVTTPGSDMKLTIGTSFEIINGTFELASTDDFVGRTRTGAYTSTPTITIQSSGSFIMDGSTSYIRSGGTVGKQIGKMTCNGTATLTSTDSRFINIDGIDIESGGEININTISTGYFNPDVITVKSGGAMNMNTTNNVWKDTASVVLNQYGTYLITTSTTNFPTTFTNNGTVRYYRTASDGTQTIVDKDYYRLELSRGPKNWTLSGNRTITDSLEINNSAALVISAESAQSVTVNGTLRLTSGSLDNSDSDVSLVMGDEALISRATGALSNAPSFTGVVDVKYTSSSQVTTGAELPTATDVLRDLTVYASGGVILGADATVNQNLTLSSGEFDNNGSGDDKVLTMADGASIRRATGTLTTAPTLSGNVNLEYISTVSSVMTGNEVPTDSGVLTDLTISGTQGVTLGGNMTVNGTLSLTGSDLTTTNDYAVTLASGAILSETSGNTVIGTIQTTRTVAQSVNNTFGGIGVEIDAAGAAPGATTVVRTTGTASTGAGNEGIQRWFDISPITNSGLNATLVFAYDESELNSLAESGLALYQSTDAGSTWICQGGSVNTDNNEITLTGIGSFSRWTAGGTGEDTSLPVSLESFTAKTTRTGVQLIWRTASETENLGFIIQRQLRVSSSGLRVADWEEIASYISVDALAGHGSTSESHDYTYTDAAVVAGVTYSYRIGDVDYSGAIIWHKPVEVTIPENGITVAEDYTLKPAYPNPFNAAFIIPFNLNATMKVAINIYNLNGRLVRNVANSEFAAGNYALHVDAADLASGIYLLKYHIGTTSHLQRIILLK